MQQFQSSQIQSWERFYRANFINSLSGIKPVSLIATVNQQAQPNLAVFSNIVHLGADPALVGFINRPKEAAPHTISNIESTGLYTINHIHPSMVGQAHQTSAKYPAHINEFEATALSAEWVEGIKAPFVKESRIKYALELRQIIPIPLNGTFLVIGEIQFVQVADEVLQADGFLDLSKAESMGSIGLDGYATFNKPVRYPYAKPNQPAEPLNG